MTLKFYSTDKKAVVDFIPLSPDQVTLYTCGPTVYSRAHIGNLRTYIFEDILKRTLELNDYKVKHLMNITDVGHLVGDGDEGEDKLLKSAREQKRTAWDVAQEYTKLFMVDMLKLNIKAPTIWSKATDYIEQQKDMVETLYHKGLTYELADGIYFDTSKFPAYADFAHLKLEAQVSSDRSGGEGQKIHPADFALWKFSNSKENYNLEKISSVDTKILDLASVTKKRDMEWDNPSCANNKGKGFPGWHLECSAMIEAKLGTPIDIHCGGVDHIPVHHTNEIAQTWGATGHELARYWLHGEFLLVDGQKMSKSFGNVYTLDDLAEHGITPEGFRFWVLQGHYRQKLNFTWEAVKGAQTGLERLKKMINNIIDFPTYQTLKSEQSFKIIKPDFLKEINNDLNTSQLIANIPFNLKVYDKSSPEIKSKQIASYILDLEQALGLELIEKQNKKENEKQVAIPESIKAKLAERELAKKNKDFKRADEIRAEIKSEGWEIIDTTSGPELNKLN